MQFLWKEWSQLELQHKEISCELSLYLRRFATGRLLIEQIGVLQAMCEK